MVKVNFIKTRLKLIALLGFILILAGIELDIFLPTLSIMQKDLGATESEITWVVTLNLLGFAFSTLFYGSLSDSIGRRPLILFGLFLFFIGSVGCYLANTFFQFLGARIIQGVGCGAPLTVCFTIVIDSVSCKKERVSLISLLNGLITGATTLAPILGAFIGILISWRANFFLLAFGALLALILAWLFLEESLPNSQRCKWQYKKALNQYRFIFRSRTAWRLGLIPILMYSALLIYIVNFPLLMSRDISDIKTIGYLQSFVMLSFVFGSILTFYLISRIELRVITIIAYALSYIGGISLLIGSYINPHLFNVLTLCMGITSVGAAFIIGLHMGKSFDIFPEIRGSLTAFQGCLRLTISSFFVMVSGLVVDENFTYISAIICMCILGSSILWIKQERNSFRHTS